MFPLLHILILVAEGPVKFIESVGILGKMGRHPVQNNPDVVLMHDIHKFHELFRFPIPGGRGKVSAGLITPGGIIGILHHRQQFHMSISHLLEIGRQLLRGLYIVKRLVGGIPPPGTQMHLIDIHRFLQIVTLGTLLQPLCIVPLVSLQIIQFGGGGRARLHMVGIGIRFQTNLPAGGLDAVFIDLHGLKLGNITFPHPVFGDTFHRMFLTVPLVKISHHRNTSGVGRPHPENKSAAASPFGGMRPHIFISFVVGSLMEQVQRQTAALFCRFILRRLRHIIIPFCIRTVPCRKTRPYQRKSLAREFHTISTVEVYTSRSTSV